MPAAADRRQHESAEVDYVLFWQNVNQIQPVF